MTPTEAALSTYFPTSFMGRQETMIAKRTGPSTWGKIHPHIRLSPLSSSPSLPSTVIDF